jgi:hypothetical protein
MEIYQTGEQWVLGLSGGSFGSLQKVPEAVILNNRPILLRKWETPTVYSDKDTDGEVWEYEYTFFEFCGDDRNIFTFQLDFRRSYHLHGVVEYFVSEEYIKEKVDYLRSNKKIATYHWSEDRQTWTEVERQFI